MMAAMRHADQDMTTHTDLLTTMQAAARLGVSPRTVTRLVLRGELTPLALPQRGYVFEQWDVDACAARRQASTRPASQ